MPFFPYNQEGQLNSVQGILGGVADISAGAGVLRVSAITAGATLSFNGDASNNRVSAVQLDAGNLMVSAKSNDASLFRVSSIGAAGTSNDLLIDGRNNLISATIVAQNFLLSGIATSARDSLFVRAYSLEADQVMVSAKSQDAGLLLVSAKSPDAALFRVSAIATTVSAFINQGTVSAYSPDASLFRISAIIDNGSVSARSGDANQVHVSATQLDAGLLLVSAKSGTASQLVASATQGDASLLRSSAFQSVVTTNTGGASFFSTSAGIAQVSTVKNSGGRLYGYHLYNPAGVDQYLQVFNVSGGATLGTDVPSLVLGIPTLGGAVMSLGAGIAFSTGIQIAATSTAAGNTAGASAVRVNMFYA